MKHEKMVLNGRTFEVGKPMEHEFNSRYAKGKTIYEAYGKPSNAKISIWFNWVHWANELNSQPDSDCGIWVESATSWIFTIAGSYGVGDKIYNIKITPSHNYIYPVI